MKKHLFFAFFVLASTWGVMGQAENLTISTSVTEDSGRFEIIQPPYDRSTTFRLDKYSGRVYRLGLCPKDDTLGSSKCWKEMFVYTLPGSSSATRPVFQIVINGPLKLITLMNVQTGKSWQYGIEPLDRWYPFIECNDRANNNCLWKPEGW